MQKKDLILAKKILEIFSIIVLLFFIVILIRWELADRLTPEEKTIQEATYVAMEVELYKTQISDFLRFNDGHIGLITNLSDTDRYYVTIVGNDQLIHCKLLAKKVAKIIKFGTPEWEELAIKYCTPPYY